MLWQPTQTGRHSQLAQGGRRYAALNTAQILPVVGGIGDGVTERPGQPLTQPAWHDHVDRRRLAIRGWSTSRNDHTNVGERRAIVRAVAAQEALYRLLPRHRRSTSLRLTTCWPCPVRADGAGRVVATAVRTELDSDCIVELALLQKCREGRVRRRAAQAPILSNQERVEAEQAGTLGEHEHAWQERRHDPVECDRLQPKRVKTAAEPQRRSNPLRPAGNRVGPLGESKPRLVGASWLSHGRR
jgi:hypothetical protein